MHNTPPRMRKAEQHVAGYLLRKLPRLRDTKCPCSQQPSPIQNAKQLNITAVDGPEALISRKAHAKKRRPGLTKPGRRSFIKSRKVKTFDVSELFSVPFWRTQRVGMPYLSHYRWSKHWQYLVAGSLVREYLHQH